MALYQHHYYNYISIYHRLKREHYYQHWWQHTIHIHIRYNDRLNQQKKIHNQYNYTINHYIIGDKILHENTYFW